MATATLNPNTAGLEQASDGGAMGTALSTGPAMVAAPGATPLGTGTELTTLPGGTLGPASPGGVAGIKATLERRFRHLV